jgi:hypothetical protein
MNDFELLHVGSTAAVTVYVAEPSQGRHYLPTSTRPSTVAGQTAHAGVPSPPCPARPQKPQRSARLSFRWQALVNEDSERGLRSAVAADIACITIHNDFTAHQDLSTADQRLPNLRALAELLVR